jgi:hypothetical protein
MGEQSLDSVYRIYSVSIKHILFRYVKGIMLLKDIAYVYLCLLLVGD